MIYKLITIFISASMGPMDKQATGDAACPASQLLTLFLAWLFDQTPQHVLLLAKSGTEQRWGRCGSQLGMHISWRKPAPVSVPSPQSPVLLAEDAVPQHHYKQPASAAGLLCCFACRTLHLFMHKYPTEGAGGRAPCSGSNIAISSSSSSNINSRSSNIPGSNSWKCSIQSV